MSDIEKVGEVVQLSSNNAKSCNYCKVFAGMEEDLGEQINHYLQHGLKLLHVGTETAKDADGNLRHHTVAILGKLAPATGDTP